MGWCARPASVMPTATASGIDAPEAIGKDRAVYSFITRHGYADWGPLSKTACARKILAEAVKILESKK